MNDSHCLKVETRYLREQLQLEDDIRFVKQVEYRKLLISHRRFERSDIPDARVLGLRDLNSGIRYVIPEEQLFAAESKAKAVTV